MARTRRVLVGYASRFGSTRDIAIRIADAVGHGLPSGVRGDGRIAPQSQLVVGKADRFVAGDERPADGWGAVDADLYVNATHVQPGEALDQDTVSARPPEHRRRRR